MKRNMFIIFGFAFFMFCSIANAGQFIGSPEPLAKKGQLSLGAGYFYGQDTLRPEDNISLSVPGLNLVWKDIDVRQNQAFFQVHYGIARGVEIFARAGAADLRSDDTFLFGSKFSGNFKPFGTVGVKIYSRIDETWGLGLFLQQSVYGAFTDEKTDHVSALLPDGSIIRGIPAHRRIDIDPSWEFNAGVSLQAKTGVLKWYAGPLFYLIGAPEVRETIWIGDQRFVATPIRYTTFSTYREKNIMGGFGGVVISFGKNITATIEGQVKQDASAGAVIGFAF